MNINIKPLDKNQIYETANQAIQHLFLYNCWAKNWKMTKSFGQSINDIRKIDTAIKAKDYSAFKASKRRGYWSIELA